MSTRKAALACLHLGAKELGLSDEARRDLLERITGQRSAKGLTSAQVGAVLDEYRRLGWRPRGGGGRGARRPSDRPDVRLIFGLWRGLAEAGAVSSSDLSRACRAWVRRQTGVDDPDWLTVEQAQGCIEALKLWRGRLTARDGGDPQR
ncbi:regulatory protein GemA [Roseospirillum parvum]|uniref:Mu-like prophage protein gp16 n=1 Tax=Roseospirillum parvum TaxID=83401 RepID=A0A1G8EZ48_9PROT|nr:regulatory protein GemA [Roseospirillum parvum]SDH75097.1 Mu-like prophage protein gp16 [Roseospirillum parvum]